MARPHISSGLYNGVRKQSGTLQTTKAAEGTLLSRSCCVFWVEIGMISITANQFFKLLQNVDMERG